jgi:hypothetical protein
MNMGDSSRTRKKISLPDSYLLESRSWIFPFRFFREIIQNVDVNIKKIIWTCTWHILLAKYFISRFFFWFNFEGKQGKGFLNQQKAAGPGTDSNSDTLLVLWTQCLSSENLWSLLITYFSGASIRGTVPSLVFSLTCFWFDVHDEVLTRLLKAERIVIKTRTIWKLTRRVFWNQAFGIPVVVWFLM